MGVKERRWAHHSDRREMERSSPFLYDIFYKREESAINMDLIWGGWMARILWMLLWCGRAGDGQRESNMHCWSGFSDTWSTRMHCWSDFMGQNPGQIWVGLVGQVRFCHLYFQICIPYLVRPLKPTSIAKCPWSFRSTTHHWSGFVTNAAVSASEKSYLKEKYQPKNQLLKVACIPN